MPTFRLTYRAAILAHPFERSCLQSEAKRGSPSTAKSSLIQRTLFLQAIPWATFGPREIEPRHRKESPPQKEEIAGASSYLRLVIYTSRSPLR